MGMDQFQQTPRLALWEGEGILETARNYLVFGGSGTYWKFVFFSCQPVLSPFPLPLLTPQNYQEIKLLE